MAKFGNGEKPTITLNKVSAWSLMASIGISALLIGYVNMRAPEHKKTVTALQTELAQIKGDISELEQQTSEVTVEVVQQELHSAQKAGDRVAELQNTWGKALTAEDQAAYDEFRSQHETVGAQTGDLLNTTRMEQLKTLFTDDSDARNWYPRIPKTKSFDSQWQFISTTSFTSMEHTVVWKCVGANGDLYAYATAVYDAGSDTFSDLFIHVTEVGIAAQGGA